MDGGRALCMNPHLSFLCPFKHSSTVCPPHPQLPLCLLRPKMEPEWLLFRPCQKLVCSHPPESRAHGLQCGVEGFYAVPRSSSSAGSGQPHLYTDQQLPRPRVSVANAEGTGIQIYLDARLHLGPASASMHFLKLWLLRQQP